jgi:very-short-patch-repair endonuclease
MDPVVVLAREGGVAPVALLHARGCSPRDIRRAVARDLAFHPRRGWIALPSAPEKLVAAARLGARISCTTALGLAGAWVPDATLTHFRVPPSERASARPGTVFHHAVAHPGAAPVVDGIVTALPLAMRCAARDDAIAVLDSIVERRLLTRAQVLLVLSELPQRLRQYGDLIDPGAQSGLETRFRLRCRALNIPCRSQVWIDGVGRVDFLVGDRLVVELDGEENHAGVEAFTSDRHRDLALKERGFLILRLTYHQVMGEWDRVERLLRDLIARREHRWSTAHRRTGLVSW